MTLNSKAAFVIKPANQMVYTFCIDFAVSNGVNVYKGTVRDKLTDINAYPFLQWSPNNQELIGGQSNKNGLYVASLDEFIEWCISHKQSKVVLNDKYTAIIHHDKKVVEVGCQEFDFDVIKELAEKLK